MSIRLQPLFVLAGVALVFIGCENRTQPVGPSTVEHARSTSATAVVQPATPGGSQHVVTMFDACDPETFNAEIGPGTCIRAGGVRFDKFIEQLSKHHSIGAWHFAPPNVSMRVGQFLVAKNLGGEVHTFTEVEEFGGGIVPFLNETIGLTTVAPECTQLGPDAFIAPGAFSSEKEEEAGVEKYQCCIHPWMRAEVRIAQK
jgi:hypothetical protein